MSVLVSSKNSLVDFNMYRNFYYVNKTNNKLFFNVVLGDGTIEKSSFSLTEGDYDYIKLQENFSASLLLAVNALSSISGVTAAVVPTDLAQYPNQTGNKQEITIMAGTLIQQLVVIFLMTVMLF